MADAKPFTSPWLKATFAVTILILAVTLTLAATACTPAQVTAFFDARGQSIDQPTAVKVAHALTVWDRQQRALLAYLVAVDRAQRTCSSPSSCAALVRNAFGQPVEQATAGPGERRAVRIPRPRKER